MRLTLPHISTPIMNGDNLGIILASHFEPSVESDELDESGTWKQGAIDAANEILDAIHVHYAEEYSRGLRDAAEIVRRNIPVLPPDGPSSPEQQIEYESLGFVMMEILSKVVDR